MIIKRGNQQYILKGKEVFIGLEDSAKIWKICVRNERMVVHETTMPAKYENLRNYLRNKFPKCKIRIMYEAGFRGFELHDSLVADGFECIVTPPLKVPQLHIKILMFKVTLRKIVQKL